MIVAARQHLQQAGETYFEHLRFASLVGSLLVAAGVACLIHALIPAFCRTSASGVVRLVNELMVDRSRLRMTASAASGPLVLTGLLSLCAVPSTMLIAGGLHAVSGTLTLLLAGLPLAYLISNPDLEPVT
jgi:hypothetical protein